MNTNNNNNNDNDNNNDLPDGDDDDDHANVPLLGWYGMAHSISLTTPTTMQVIFELTWDETTHTNLVYDNDDITDNDGDFAATGYDDDSTVYDDYNMTHMVHSETTTIMAPII